MRYLKPKVVLTVLVIFIAFHVVLGEANFFARSNQDIFPLGMSPSITHDSLSTRNPGIEDPLAIFVDLPGGYSFYLSTMIITLPLLLGNELNEFHLPQLIDIANPANPTLTQIEINRLLFLGASGIFILLFSIVILYRQVRKRRNNHQ